MSYEFDIAEVGPVTLAVTEAIVKQSDIPNRIIGMFDIVYAWLRDSAIEQTGHNYVLYQIVSDGIRMQVGFPVTKRFNESESVKCLELNGSRTAHTKHRGAYAGLPNAHAQLHAWCAQQSLSLDVLSWEVYGDWHDDPEKLETDIYIQLK